MVIEMEYKPRKTVLFEKVYGVNIENISTTKEVDEIIERKTGRKLRVVNVEMFPIRSYDIDEMVDEALRE
ncbi:MAG: hypothetical protein DRP11_02240 [Candidatus Aenigmatarchaeota archaeon]|nr:MAG: hypothetical protein DRP11_02240 [Candidatus Aenigmarchaeota archaeon]